MVMTMFRLSCVLVLLLLTYKFRAQTADAPFIPRDESNCNCVDCGLQRTLSNVIWGCVSTTIICAWAAIHPNIPPREGPFKGTLRRLEFMFWTLVAPEILPVWALNQRMAAVITRDLYNEKKGYKKERCGIWKTVKGWFSLYEKEEEAARSQAWSLKHGHFLIMGGFHLVEPVEGSSEATGTEAVQPTSSPLVEVINADAEKGSAPASESNLTLKEGRVTILTLEMLEELVKDPAFEMQVTEDEITDKSKGDALSKFIFILQSSWFILQSLARCHQGLNISQLELTTLALASLNGITFILWWDKPLGAHIPLRVYLKRKLTDAERKVQERDQPMRSKLFPWLHRTFGFGMTAIRNIILCRSEANIFVAWLIQLPFYIVLLLFFPIIAFALAFVFAIIDLVGGSNSFPVDAKRVPTFYVPSHKYSENLHALHLVILGSVFGAVHCAGWNSPFPTFAEQKLWRVASLAVTFIPIALFPIPVIILSILRLFLPDDESNSRATVFITIIASIAMLMYASARLVLLGQAIALLKHQPPSTFVIVDWTKFYPRFF